MHEGGAAIAGLYQVWLHRLLQQHRHRRIHAQVLASHWLNVARVPHDHPTESRVQVTQIARDRENRHHLRRWGDIEALLARDAIHRAAHPHNQIAQGTVVHVQAAPPCDPTRIQPVRIAVEH